MVRDNDAVYIPMDASHRLENPGRGRMALQLQLIEAQCGSYVAEEDIVRFEDVYGRSGTIA